MVMSNHSYEEQTRRLLSDIKSELQLVDEEISKLIQKQTMLAKEVEAYQVALESYLRRSGKQVGTEFDWTKVLASAETHKERIKLIAEKQGGRIKVSQATDILYSKGFIKSKKRSTAYVMVQGMLAEMADSGIFEKVGQGEYKLIGAQQILLDSDAH
ncbi:MAG: hypothetical protein FJ004_04615 [Chloroflexi bacterium]|nr:hypothetical protein [Chloroflexota bacterium]